MSLSDFTERNISRLEQTMRRLAHNTLMGDNGMDETVLIAMGKYRQLKAERDYWLALRKKQNEPESTMEELPDDTEDELPPANPRPVTRRPRAWGGQ
jgi:hypothetical protein